MVRLKRSSTGGSTSSSPSSLHFPLKKCLRKVTQEAEKYVSEILVEVKEERSDFDLPPQSNTTVEPATPEKRASARYARQRRKKTLDREASLRRRRASNSSSASDSDSDRPFACSACDFRAKSKSHLSTHRRIHDGRVYECAQCDHMSLTPQAHKVHLLSHSDEKKFVCDECDARFKYSSDLFYHRRRHTGEALRCKHPKCTYTTPQKNLMRAHRLTHTGERPHKCDRCEMSFAEKGNLTRHKRMIHLAQKRHKCESCEYSSPRIDLLKRHQLTCGALQVTNKKRKAPKRTNAGRKKVKQEPAVGVFDGEETEDSCAEASGKSSAAQNLRPRTAPRTRSTTRASSKPSVTPSGSANAPTQSVTEAEDQSVIIHGKQSTAKADGRGHGTRNVTRATEAAPMEAKVEQKDEGLALVGRLLSEAGESARPQVKDTAVGTPPAPSNEAPVKTEDEAVDDSSHQTASPVSVARTASENAGEATDAVPMMTRIKEEPEVQPMETDTETKIEDCSREFTYTPWICDDSAWDEKAAPPPPPLELNQEVGREFFEAMEAVTCLAEDATNAGRDRHNVAYWSSVN